MFFARYYWFGVLSTYRRHGPPQQERKNGIAPTDPVREERIAKVDVPCYVVFDMESYSLGYSNAAVF
jgi:hypothetical protein